jgi:hypothetical protein
MAFDPRSLKETALEVENAGLRELLTQAGIDAAVRPSASRRGAVSARA